MSAASAPGRDDEELLRASIAHVSPSQLKAGLRDRRPWVRAIAEAEADRRANLSPSQLAAALRDPRPSVRRIAEAEAERRAAEQADEVVCREPLRVIITVFVARWKIERPPMGGQFAENRTRADVAHVPALDWLSTNSGVPRGTIENIARPRGGRSAVVPYDVADALVAAIGCPQVMYDGTLEATSRRAASCCSGSLTG